jgi:hypothetical protein
MSTTKSALDLITESIRHDSIVTVRYTSELADELDALSDDTVHTWTRVVEYWGVDPWGTYHPACTRIIEYWGVDPQGDDWRVHLVDVDGES